MKKKINTRLLQVRLPEELLQELRKSATLRGLSVSAFVRLLIINQIKNKRKGELKL